MIPYDWFGTPWVMSIALAILILFLGLAAGLVWLVRKIISSPAHLPVTAAWIDELSMERYRPMLRLLDAGDLDFLRAQPGFTEEMASRIRRQR